MVIDINTQVIARLHTTDNGTGLNIYNPYFEAVGINAVYVLFKNEKPGPLVQGMRNLQITGAITAGFEYDAELPTLVDAKSEAVELAQRIGIISNKSGKLYAHYQGGEGLLAAISEKYDLAGKRIVVVGAGTVAKTLLLALQQSGMALNDVVLVNRTPEHAQVLAELFKIDSVYSLDELALVDGDILVNATYIGSKVADSYFTADVVRKYMAVADVTFGELRTSLVALAESNGAIAITGWDMFTHQAAVVLRELLGHKADIHQLRQFVVSGLSSFNQGTVAPKIRTLV